MIRARRTEGVSIAVLVAATIAGACTAGAPAEPTFEAVVERVIQPRCTFGSCHAAPTNAAALDLTPARICDMLIDRPSCLFPDRMRIVPGRPEDSFFFHKLTGEGLHEAPTGGACAAEAATNEPMPYGARGLDDDELELVHGWIAAGAPCTGTGPTQPTGPAIASFTASHAAPLAGELVTFTVTLDRAAPEGGQRLHLETDTTALAAPLQVMVPASQATVRFDAFAMRPTSRFAMRVRTGESAKQLVLRIAGLDISEVLANPSGSDDQLQWIKLRNRTSRPIDLAGYQLKAGQGSYDLVTVELAGTIPAGGCGVIGGPKQSGANSEPMFVQAIDFTPNLPHGGAQAAGFAVFDAGAAPIGGVATPVDTMLVGEGNAARLLGPDAEIASPHCDKPPAGMSALRTGLGTCTAAQMQPNTCL